MANSTSARSGAKSARPKKPAFPLWLHSTGQGATKIRGKYYYFGKDRDAALKEYARVKDDLESGRRPPPRDDQQCSLKDLANSFLTHKQSLVKSGELSQRTFLDYYATCEGLLEHFGKRTAVESLRPDELLTYRRKLSETRKSVVTLGNEVQRCRVVLRFAFEHGLIDRPIRVGEFRRPSKAAQRRHRATSPERIFEAAELRSIIGAANVQLRAMTLLAINCGFGNDDVARLPIAAICDGWIDYPRPKTAIARRCPLWEETRDAIDVAISVRPKPKDAKQADLVFITKRGGAWYRDGGKPSSAVTHEFRKLLQRLGLYARGKSFYTVRHTFQTVSDEVGDYIATKLIMGHATDSDISGQYRERFKDDRLQRVTDYVRGWLFGERP